MTPNYQDYLRSAHCVDDMRKQIADHIDAIEAENELLGKKYADCTVAFLQLTKEFQGLHTENQWLREAFVAMREAISGYYASHNTGKFGACDCDRCQWWRDSLTKAGA